jgi:hypothetical protein
MCFLHENAPTTLALEAARKLDVGAARAVNRPAAWRTQRRATGTRIDIVDASSRPRLTGEIAFALRRMIGGALLSALLPHVLAKARPIDVDVDRVHREPIEDGGGERERRGRPDGSGWLA